MEKLTLQSNHSKLSLNIEKGAQIESLEFSILNSFSVIQPFNDSKSFFLSGNFLLYPWVNRLEKQEIVLKDKIFSLENSTKDELSRPIHGLYFDKKRKIISLSKNTAIIEPIEFLEEFPQFQETYRLNENQLSIKIEFTNKSSLVQEFSFGYHPYLRLPKKINELYLFTNIESFIPLSENLLPPQKEYLEKKSISDLNLNQKIGSTSLDHLFIRNHSDNFFSLYDKEEDNSLTLSVSKNSSYQFFQVYTPSDRESIAIEPMSSTGNSFYTPNSNLINLSPNQSFSAEFLITLQKGLYKI